jgi:two-component system response regulator NreC
MADVTVLLAEDHTIVRKGLRSLLDGQPGIRVVGEAEDGREALAQVERLKPDIVLMDISMPLLNGIEATRQIRALRAGTRVIVLTVHSHEEYVLQALHAGARGYLPKSAAPDELVAAIRAVSQGEPFLSQSLPCTAAAECLRKAAPDPYERVTPREREVLQLIAEGHRNREIAELLHISVKTVETHRAHLLEKLGVRSTAELTQYAIRKGVIAPET